MFEQAHHFTIGKIEVSGQQADALKDLCDNIAAGALLNSRERSDAPKCHPETRVAVQQELFSFVTDNDESAQPRRMLWLTGPAGSGKTTIMNTVGERFKRKGNLAAAFFFSSFSGSRERGTKDRFVTTLAYQLIQDDSVPAIRGEVLSSVAKNPAIFRMSLKEQMEVLILRPLRLCDTQGDSAVPTQVILIDGLDECGQNPPEDSPLYIRDAARLSRELDQAEILDVLLDASNDPAFPFRIVIASRPEPAIDEFFFTSAKNHSTAILLDNKYNPNADITLFLNSHLARIRRKHRLPPSWPGEDVVSQLVANASEQMIYAVTVVRFIETPSKSPRELLEIILEDRPSSTLGLPNPFGPLDTLYARILNSSPDPELVLVWLMAYHRLDIEEGFSTWCFNRLCESSEGEPDRLFANTSALFSSLNHDDPESARYIFYHKSFQDFLRNRLRYGVFFTLSEQGSHRWLIECFLGVFERSRPVVPLTESLGNRFTEEIFKLWYFLISERNSFTESYDERLLRCDANWWIPRVNLRDQGGRAFSMLMFVVSHNQCRSFRPCRKSCKRWRKLILKAWRHTSRDSVHISLPGKAALLLDRFGLERIPLRSTGFGVTLFHQNPGPGSTVGSYRYPARYPLELSAEGLQSPASTGARSGGDADHHETIGTRAPSVLSASRLSVLGIPSPRAETSSWSSDHSSRFKNRAAAGWLVDGDPSPTLLRAYSEPCLHPRPSSVKTRNSFTTWHAGMFGDGVPLENAKGKGLTRRRKAYTVAERQNLPRSPSSKSTSVSTRQLRSLLFGDNRTSLRNGKRSSWGMVETPPWVETPPLSPLGLAHSELYHRRSRASSVQTHNSVATGHSGMFGDRVSLKNGRGVVMTPVSSIRISLEAMRGREQDIDNATPIHRVERGGRPAGGGFRFFRSRWRGV